MFGCDPVYVQRFAVRPHGTIAAAGTRLVVTDSDTAACLKVVARVAEQHHLALQKSLAGSDPREIAHYALRSETNHTWIRASVLRSPLIFKS
jgi:hypothetical protein